MKHFASPAFWEAYRRLPERIRALADKNYALLKENPTILRYSLRKLDDFGRCVSVSGIVRSPSKPTTIFCGSGLAHMRTMTHWSAEQVMSRVTTVFRSANPGDTLARLNKGATSKCYRLEGTGGASVSMRGPVTSAILAILVAAMSGGGAARAQPQSAPEPLDPAIAASVAVADRVPPGPPPSAADPVCEKLAAAAAENDLPLAFFTRLIWQESRFDPDAVSRAGAQGIAQFMPKTAAWVGLDDPFDPIGAVAKSAQFLRSLRTQFGNLGLAAAAYNAGPKRVEDWLAGRRRLPRETRAYVRIVTGHAADEWMAGAPSGQNFALPDSVPCPQLAALFARDRLGRSQAIPAREPKPETAATPPERPWGVQLVGNASPVAALAAYAELQKRYKTVLGSRQPLLLRSPAGRNAAWYRVRVAAETRGDAERLCAGLRAIGGSCLVQRN